MVAYSTGMHESLDVMQMLRICRQGSQKLITVNLQSSSLKNNAARMQTTIMDLGLLVVF